MILSLSHSAYTVGLGATMVALFLMKTAQPALLYLVPTTLGTTVLLSLCRREFRLFFTEKVRCLALLLPLNTSLTIHHVLCSRGHKDLQSREHMCRMLLPWKLTQTTVKERKKL